MKDLILLKEAIKYFRKYLPTDCDVHTQLLLSTCQKVLDGEYVEIESYYRIERMYQDLKSKLSQAKMPEKKEVGYECSHCGHWEPIEREVKCWKCGIGEMVYQSNNKAFNEAIDQITPYVAKLEMENKELKDRIEKAVLQIKEFQGEK